uniref:HigA family addiction module antitoxin n=1 Tax=Turicimonas muris TaxID=1796652 RepID=UPI002675B64A
RWSLGSRRFLDESGVKVGRALGISRRRVNELVVGKRSITPSTAIKLARFFNTDPEFWLTLQMHWDLYQELEKEKRQSLPAQ